MPNEPLPDDLLRVWQDQPVENTTMPLEEIRRKARQFEKRIRNRNLREYCGAAIAVIAYSYYIFKFSDFLVRAGSVLVIAGTLYVVYQLHKRASVKPLPADLALTASLAFHRRELERQRDLVASVWSWYLAPFVPGLLVFTKGVAPKHGPGFLFALAFFALGFGAIWWFNRRAAVRLTRQISELDSLGS